MKTLYILFFFMASGFSSYCQEIDKNGRNTNQQAAKQSITETKSALEEVLMLKSVFGTTLNFSLPEGKTSGEIILFHPKKDLALKTIIIGQNQGTVQILAKDITEKNVIVGLYAEGKLIATRNLKL